MTNDAAGDRLNPVVPSTSDTTQNPRCSLPDSGRNAATCPGWVHRRHNRHSNYRHWRLRTRRIHDTDNDIYRRASVPRCHNVWPSLAGRCRSSLFNSSLWWSVALPPLPAPSRISAFLFLQIMDLPSKHSATYIKTCHRGVNRGVLAPNQGFS